VTSVTTDLVSVVHVSSSLKGKQGFLRSLEARMGATRRSFFQLGAAAAASALLPARKAGAQSSKRVAAPSPRTFQLVQQMEAPPVPAAWKSASLRLLRRATYAPTAADRAAVAALGYQGWLNQQLKYKRIDDTAVDTFVATNYPLLAGSVATIYNTEINTVMNQLQQATIYRAAFSKRQLYERMVEFWSDHFNIYVGKVSYLKIIDDRDVIRKYALGRFGDMVKASAKSAAMLAYLDQTTSRVGAPNQNYARELMELHTLGVDGGYTQNDVAELSRVLTGWTIAGRGDFAFTPALHDWGAKTVMGMTIPAGAVSQGQAGMKEGEAVIDMLIAHPSTAAFVSRKMIRWLLNSEPTDTQVATIVGVYKVTGGDISAMVRAILNDAWMAAAPARYKRPYHLLVSSMRAAGAAVTATTTVNAQLTAMGHSQFTWETPDGYPDSVEYWSGGAMPRWQMATAMSNYKTTAITVDHTPFLTGGVDGTIDQVDQRIFSGEMSAGTKASLRAYLAAGTLNETRVREIIGLALAASDFQWY
jgi:uncharacterized protein (DUF1800 family)